MPDSWAAAQQPRATDREHWRRFQIRFGYLLGNGGVYTGLDSCASDLGSGIRVEQIYASSVGSRLLLPG